MAPMSSQPIPTSLSRLSLTGFLTLLWIALVLAWAVLGQSIALMQLVGALVVVATVMCLGLRRR